MIKYKKLVAVLVVALFVISLMPVFSETAQADTGDVQFATELKTQLVNGQRVIMFANNQIVKVNASDENVVLPFIENDRTFLPLRLTAEAFDVEVEWYQETQRVYIEDKIIPRKLNFEIGQNSYISDKELKQMDASTFIKNGRTVVPARAVAEELNLRVEYKQLADGLGVVFNFNDTIDKEEQDRQIAEITQRVQNLQKEIERETVKTYKKYVSAGGRNVNVDVAEIPLEGFSPKVAIAYDSLGKAEGLAGMTNRQGASASINGGYFQAYSSSLPKDAYANIINDGKVIHVGDIGCTIGFTNDGQIKLEMLKIKLEGSTNGSYEDPNNWKAYGMNNTPSKDGTSIYIYTRERGNMLGFSHGTNVIVKNGLVSEIVSDQDVVIPENGFVINFMGAEQYLVERFKIGEPADYRVKYEDPNGKPLDWSNVTTALSAGPMLVKNGQIVLNAKQEGFTGHDILTGSAIRSALGINNNKAYLVVTPKVTVSELANIMKNLGYENALNLDGGASSGIYANGEYLVKPWRAISHALVFIKK